MKVAIVKSSDLGNRWDAGFHIARDEVRDRVAVLKTMLTVQEARKRLAKFSLTDKKPLLVLARGTNRHLNSVTISKIDEEYPHLSLAIMEQNLQRSEEHTSELQSLMRISYAVFCLKKKTQSIKTS